MNFLLIDDDEDVLECMRESLVCHGHEVMTAKNGFDGLALAERGRFDVIVSDWQMPIMNGEEFLFAYGGHVPVIIASGANVVAPKARLILKKPYAAEDLIEAAEEMRMCR